MFCTTGAISAMVLPGATEMVPLLMTLPESPPVNWYLPARKLALSSRKVLATRPPTFTCEPAPNSTPLGFKINTWPLALMLPMMALVSAPVTRLSVMELALGWLKRTDSLLPTENLAQSMAALLLVWLMVVALPAWLMVALPAVTWPPVGPASPGRLNIHSAAPKAVAVSVPQLDFCEFSFLPVDLPWPLALSVTA